MKNENYTPNNFNGFTTEECAAARIIARRKLDERKRLKLHFGVSKN